MIAWIADNPVIATILGILIVYPLVIRALAKAVWPVRAALADNLRVLAHAPNLPSSTRKALRTFGDFAFAWWMMPALAVAFPFTVVERLVSNQVTSRNPLNGLAPQTQARVDQVMLRFVVSTGARNPIFALVFAAEVAVVAAVHIVATRLRSVMRAVSVEAGAGQRRSSTLSGLQALYRTLLNAVGRFDQFLTRLS
jgi:hypothetical protein